VGLLIISGVLLLAHWQIRVHLSGPMSDHQATNAVQALNILLLHTLAYDKAHVGALYRFADGFGICRSAINPLRTIAT
jgi:hypothetical protein